MRTLVCLEVFDERGLIRLEHTTDHLHIALAQRGRQGESGRVLYHAEIAAYIIQRVSRPGRPLAF